jgi:hypothetical protein
MTLFNRLQTPFWKGFTIAAYYYGAAILIFVLLKIILPLRHGPMKPTLSGYVYTNSDLYDLNSIINQLPEGISELMCHPGRPGERKVLMDADILKNLEVCHVKLGQFASVRK